MAKKHKTNNQQPPMDDDYLVETSNYAEYEQYEDYEDYEDDVKNNNVNIEEDVEDIDSFEVKYKKSKLSPSELFSYLALRSDRRQRSYYEVVSSRIIFGLIVLSIFAYSVYTFTRDDEDLTMRNASYSPSETSQLKIKVMQLQQQIEDLNLQIDELNEDLDLYKEKYGELQKPQSDDDSDNSSEKKASTDSANQKEESSKKTADTEKKSN